MAGLETVVARLVGEWGLDDLGVPYAGGSHSLVAPVSLRNGSQAVLKVLLVDDENRLEAEALKLYDGGGAVRLFAFDDRSGAMLLEQASPGTSLENHPDRAAAIEIGCALLRRLRRRAPACHAFTLATDKAREWSRGFDAALEQTSDPVARWLLAGAGVAIRELTSNSMPAYLVNRDTHLGNVLAARREPWLLIDPKPLVGDPAFDAGYLVDWLLGDDPSVARGEWIVSTVAAALDVEQARVRTWALVRAMDNYLWSLDEHRDDPTPYLREAAALTVVGGAARQRPAHLSALIASIVSAR
jgi:streptomycin 6-kinase